MALILIASHQIPIPGARTKPWGVMSAPWRSIPGYILTHHVFISIEGQFNLALHQLGMNSTDLASLRTTVKDPQGRKISPIKAWLNSPSKSKKEYTKTDLMIEFAMTDRDCREWEILVQCRLFVIWFVDGKGTRNGYSKWSWIVWSELAWFIHRTATRYCSIRCNGVDYQRHQAGQPFCTNQTIEKHFRV